MDQFDTVKSDLREHSLSESFPEKQDEIVTQQVGIIVGDVVEVSGAILALEDWTESADYQQTQANVTGQVAESSTRVYLSEARMFARWLQERGYGELSREAIIAYHKHLRAYRPNTAARKWSIVKQLVGEHIIRHGLPDLARGIKGYKKGESDTHIALTEDEARLLLAQPDRTTKLGMRDYALLRVLLRLALRRSECARLTVGCMGMQQGHHTLSIWGKGQKFRLLKLPVDVWRTLIDYHEALGNVIVPTGTDGERLYEGLEWRVSREHRLFVGFDKGDRPTHKGIVGDTVYRIVKARARQAGLDKMTAHSTRATSITLMLEKDVPLWMVQDLAGHADPRTTRAYQKRRDQLDRSAADALTL